MPRQIARPLGILAVVVLSTLSAIAQQQRTTEVRSFEVVSVSGNTVVVRDQHGTQEYTVPPDFRFTVGNQQVTVRALKPGMKGTATITTTTTVTPVHVTNVRNVDVVQVSANSMIVRGPEGFRMYSEQDLEKSGARIFKDGRPVAFSDLSVGDKLTATIVTQGAPKVVTEREVQQATLTQPPAAVRTRAPTAAASSVATPVTAPAPAPTSAVAGTPPINAAASAASAAAAQPLSTGAAYDGKSAITWLSWPVIWSIGALLLVLLVVVVATRSRRLT